MAKRKVIDPTTSNAEYDPSQVEFGAAMDRYRRINSRPFPTWSEVLEVLLCLGYRKVSPARPLPGETSTDDHAGAGDV